MVRASTLFVAALALAPVLAVPLAEVTEDATSVTRSFDDTADLEARKFKFKKAFGKLKKLAKVAAKFVPGPVGAAANLLLRDGEIAELEFRDLDLLEDIELEARSPVIPRIPRSPRPGTRGRSSSRSRSPSKGARGRGSKGSKGAKSKAFKKAKGFAKKGLKHASQFKGARSRFQGATGLLNSRRHRHANVESRSVDDVEDDILIRDFDDEEIEAREYDEELEVREFDNEALIAELIERGLLEGEVEDMEARDDSESLEALD
jgi:hypothetical protein